MNHFLECYTNELGNMKQVIVDKTVISADDKLHIVRNYLNSFISEYSFRSENNGKVIFREDNGECQGVESYWVYFDSRRYARLDVYKEKTDEEAYQVTKDYLKKVTTNGLSMTPFIGYITYNGGLKLYLYRRGPSISPVDFDHFVSLTWAFYRQDKIDNKHNPANKFLRALHKIVKDSAISEEKKKRIVTQLTTGSLDFSDEIDIVRLNSKAENVFFVELLKDYEDECLTMVCRYTSVNSLFRMLNDRRSSMLSIVSMNDKSECTYVKEFLLKRNCEVSKNGFLENNRFYIQSCADIKLSDDLFMWMMYGENAQGVCIEYEVDKSLLEESRLILSRISYGKDAENHPELELISEMIKSVCSGKKFSFESLDTWQHFFKSREYYKENEVRLLLEKGTCEDTKWVKTDDGIMTPIQEFAINENYKSEGLPVFPLKIKSIIVGPKCPNASTVVSQINAIINLHNSLGYSCDVRHSTITSLR